MADTVSIPKPVTMDFPTVNGRQGPIPADPKFLSILANAKDKLEKGQGLAFTHKTEQDVRKFVNEIDRAARDMNVTVRKRFLTAENDLRDKIGEEVRTVLISVQDKITRSGKPSGSTEEATAK